MFNPERLLGQVMNGVFGGGASGEKKNKGISAMGGFGGGMKLQAGIGLLGVAMAAFEHFKEKQANTNEAGGAPMLPPPPPPAAGFGAPNFATQATPAHATTASMPPPFAVPPIAAPAPLAPLASSAAALPEPRAEAALHLLRSMIAAAHADGVLDAQERQLIVGRAREAKLPADDLMALGSELAAPRSLAQIVTETRNEYRRETYAAAVLAISVDTEAERAYLQQLAAGLALPAADIAQIHHQLGLAP